MEKIKTNKKLYWALIGTFALLYISVAFVSTLHAITFFKLTNTLTLAILLGAAYEIAQSSVLFSILTTENKNKGLAWGMMFLLTFLQITANVYASFRYMDGSGSNDWTYWQRSILFWVEADGQEMYKVIISWIAGALLPIVALGLTALIADNIKLASSNKENNKIIKIDEGGLSEGGQEKEEETPSNEDLLEKRITEEVEKRLQEMENNQRTYSLTVPNREESLEELQKAILSNQGKESYIEEKPIIGEGGIEIIHPQIEVELPLVSDQSINKLIPENISKEEKELKKDESFTYSDNSDIHNEIEEESETFLDLLNEKYNDQNINSSYIPYIKSEIKEPVNKMQGWKMMKEYVDLSNNVFHKGVFIENNPEKTPTLPKKA